MASISHAVNLSIEYVILLLIVTFISQLFLCARFAEKLTMVTKLFTHFFFYKNLCSAIVLTKLNYMELPHIVPVNKLSVPILYDTRSTSRYSLVIRLVTR